jgi:hypothetical protein
MWPSRYGRPAGRAPGGGIPRRSHLCLIGVAGYEGLMPEAATGEPAGLETYLESIAQTARELKAAGLFAAGRVPLVSAGGSSYFDRVVARLGPDRFDFPMLLRRWGFDGTDRGAR